MSTLIAGSSQVDISPKDSQFLFGYPHVERYSTGIHDPLLSSALYLSDGKTGLIFVANDIIFVCKQSSAAVRKRINELTGVPAANIMISATHTHSGPITLNYLSNEADPVVPKADPAYVKLMEDGIVESALNAFKSAKPAKIGLAIADGSGVGTNRRDPKGPSDPAVPVLLVKSADGKTNIACMLVCSMHPTVLHEDSKLVSGDFPGLTRQYLQKILGTGCPILHHTGPSGNQSPRHVTKANTFDEVRRLGEILGREVEKVLPAIQLTSDITLACADTSIDLPKRKFPDVAQAASHLEKTIARLDNLRKTGAPRQDVRTAECDWFGAEETLTIAKAAKDGKLEQAYNVCLPAEVQLFKVGPWLFAGWQGELFVDYALELKKNLPNVFVISMANGELQGYIVTEEAAREGGYEASNALLSYQSGDRLIETTLNLAKTL